MFAFAALYLVDDPRQFRTFMTMMPSSPEAFAGERPHLLVEAQNGWANEPLPLGVMVEHASVGASVTIEGLPDGAELSLGTRADRFGWSVTAADLEQSYVGAPMDFVGVMEPTATLRSASGTLLDRQVLRFEWHTSKNEAPDPVPMDNIIKETASSPIAAVKSNELSPLPSTVPLPPLASMPDIVAPERETVGAKRGVRLRNPHRQLSPAWVNGTSNALERPGPTPTVNFFSLFSWNYLLGAQPTRGQAQPSGKSQARITEGRRVIRRGQ
jgi:hypothetical protein